MSVNLTVNEIFYSLQGEGSRAGIPNIFIRLSKCNLNCWFCDTEFESGESYSLEQLVITSYSIHYTKLYDIQESQGNVCELNC